MGTIVPFHTRASAGHRSGLNSSRRTPVAVSIRSTNSAGTPFFERRSQYQTCDCVVPMHFAKCSWPPAIAHALFNALVDMPASYADLGETQPAKLCGTPDLIFGSQFRMRPVDKRAFGDRVRSRRVRLGIPSQRFLGEMIGVPQQTIGNIENGTVERPRFMRELSHALATSDEWLLWGEGPEDVGTRVIYSDDQILALIQAVSQDKRRIVLRIIESLAGAA